MRRFLCAIGVDNDNVEDYFHDAIVKQLIEGKKLEDWLGLVYRCVHTRLRYKSSNEKTYLQLDEVTIPVEDRLSINTKIDIKNAWEKLSPRERSYIDLNFWHGLSYKAIAQKEHISHQMVDKIIDRGLKKLSESLRGK